MNDGAGGAGPPHASARHGPRYRHREIDLAEDGKLVLRTDGSIAHVDGQGATAESWTPDDPGWPDQAIRFGLRPQARTVRPDGRGGQGPKPPSW